MLRTVLEVYGRNLQDCIRSGDKSKGQFQNYKGAQSIHCTVQGNSVRKVELAFWGNSSHCVSCTDISAPVPPFGFLQSVSPLCCRMSAKSLYARPKKLVSLISQEIPPASLGQHLLVLKSSLERMRQKPPCLGL